ncbi:GntR family transcriptional regulator [Microbacteriaceae bacterium VKM Ac-2854]|nr:GntR family transcriptional regulator [Microbacteriaceae bacterium VKM Ac-2854]
MREPNDRLPASVFAAVDRASVVPLYVQLADGIERAITDGRLGPGHPLSSEVEIHKQYGFSVATVKRAVGRLVDRGLLVRRRGVGTSVIADAGPEQRHLSLYDELRRSGRAVSTDVLLAQPRPAGAVEAAALRIEPGRTVLYLERVRRADGEPIALLRTWVATGYEGVELAALTGSGLHQLLGLRGSGPVGATQDFGASSATTEQARLLAVPPGSPLLVVRRTAYLDTGEPVLVGTHSYVPSRFTVRSRW